MSGNYPRVLRKLETHSIDGSVLDAVKLVLVQVLGWRVFEQDCGIAFLSTWSNNIQYNQLSDDLMEAEVRFFGFRCRVFIDGLLHHMNRIVKVEVLEHLQWLPQSTTIQLMLKTGAHLFEFNDQEENDRITQLLGRFLGEAEVRRSKRNMCPIPFFEIKDGKEDELNIKAVYMFDDSRVAAVEIKWVTWGDQGGMQVVSAIVRLNGETGQVVEV